MGSNGRDVCHKKKLQKMTQKSKKLISCQLTSVNLLSKALIRFYIAQRFSFVKPRSFFSIFEWYQNQNVRINDENSWIDSRREETKQF